MMMYIGIVYAWSTFITPIRMEMGWSHSAVNLSFSVCLTFFTIGGIVSGRCSRRFSLGAALSASAVSIAAGFLICAAARFCFMLYIGFGLLCGFGIGMCYNILMTLSVLLFPRKNGLIQGVMLMSFGLSGAVMGMYNSMLILRFGWRTSMSIHGVCCCLLMFAFAVYAKVPDWQRRSGASVTAVSMFRDKSFYLFYLRTLFWSCAGLSIISNSATIAETVAGSALLLAGIAGIPTASNSLGRVVGGVYGARLGIKKTLVLNSYGVLIGIALTVVSICAGSLPLLAGAYAFFGFFHGANLPSYMMYLQNRYGKDSFGTNLGYFNSYIIISSYLGPYMFSCLYDAVGDYYKALFLPLVFSAASLALAYCIGLQKDIKLAAKGLNGSEGAGQA